MKKLFLTLYFSFIPAAFLSDYYNKSDLLNTVGSVEAVVNLILIFYYIKSKKSKFVLIDLYLIEALMFTSVGGTLLLFSEDRQLQMFINTVGFYLTQFMFINIFRAEGSYLPALSLILKEWKIIFLTIVFFIGLAFLLITYTPNSLLLISFVYSTQMTVLFWMAYFRPIPRKGFVMSFAGVFLLIMANLWLAINLLYRDFDYSAGIYFMIYLPSQFLLVESVLCNRNEA